MMYILAVLLVIQSSHHTRPDVSKYSIVLVYIVCRQLESEDNPDVLPLTWSLIIIMEIYSLNNSEGTVP